jgi:sodium/pantothenate symporter
MPWAAIVGVQIFMNFSILVGVGKAIAIIARRLNALSIGDIIFKRADEFKPVAIAYALIVFIFYSAYAASQFLGSARLFEVMTGFPFYYALIIAGVVTIIYSTFGGIRGVALSAVVQGIVMTVATIFLVVFVFRNAINNYGSLINVNKALADTAGEKFISLYMPLKWQFGLWFVFDWGLIALPHGLLSALAYKSTKALKSAVILGAVVVTFWTFGMLWSGLLAKLFVPGLKVADYAIPTMAIKFSPLLGGIVFSGVVAAAQSTIAVMIMTISGALLQQLYKITKPTATPEQLKKASIYTMLIAAGVPFLLALIQLPALEWIIVFAIGGTTSALLASIVLGLFWKRGSKYAMLSSMLVGLIVYMIGKSFYKPLAMGMDASVVGTLSSFLVYIIVTLIMNERPSQHVLSVFWGSQKPS